MDKLNIGGLCIEITGYQHQTAGSHDDANWLGVSVGYVGYGTSTWFGAPCLMTTDLLAFRRSLADLRDGVVGSARLASHEPKLSVDLIKQGSLGGLIANVMLCPETVVKSITLALPMDQSYLPRMIAELDLILAKYPVRTV